MVAIYEHANDPNIEQEADEAAASFETFVQSEIEIKRTNPGDDLLTQLIQVEEEGDKLNLEELVTTCILLLNAGHEATVHGIGNGVKSILENGVDTKSTFTTSEGRAAVVEESLRYDPPLHMFPRYVLEDLEYGGQKFSRGDVIGLMLGSANRDPLKFDHADSFDLARGGTGHVTFGAGIHFCVGAPLARLELEIALAALFDRLPGLHLAEQPSYADRYHFHGLRQLKLSW